MRAPATDLSLDACSARHRAIGGRAALAAVASVGSTNRLARRVAEAYLESGRTPPRLALVARQQTAGRGRRGRRWESPAGQGIYASLLLAVTDANALAALPLEVPLALCEALDAVDAGCGIKWPNDLVVAGRKLGGVLIEALAGPRAVVIGFGLNGNQEEGQLPVPGATSLALVTGGPVDLSGLAVDLAAAVLERIEENEPMHRLVEAYSRRTVHRPGDPLVCRLGDRQTAGRFAGFDEAGRLLLDTEDGPRVFAAADLIAETSSAEGGEPGAPAP